MPELSKNLMSARSQPSVWDRPASTLQLYDRERWITAAWGSALTMVGARRGGFGRGLLATFCALLVVPPAMGPHGFPMAHPCLGSPITSRGPRGQALLPPTPA